MTFTPEHIKSNCALGDHCDCADGKVRHEFDGPDEAKPWLCPNWGRSSLAFPRIGHTEAHYTGQQKHDLQRKLDDRRRKHDAWQKNTDAHLAEVRRDNPVRHLRKKGVKVAR